MRRKYNKRFLCSYCGQLFSDTAEHLRTQKKCRLLHAEKLQKQFGAVLSKHQKTVEFFKNKSIHSEKEKK